MTSRILRGIGITWLVFSLFACTGSPAEPSPSGEPPTAIAVVQPTAIGAVDQPAPTVPAENDATPPVEQAATPTPAGPAGPTPTPAPTKPPRPFLESSLFGIELIGQNFGSRAGLASSAGASWIRWNAILWSSIEPTQGDRIWQYMSVFEQQVLALQGNNLNLIAIVRSAPVWAQAIPGSYCGPILEDTYDDFGEFMYELVLRYSGPPYNIKYWEIGNEPDVDPRLVPGDQIFGCWGDENDEYYGGGTYAELLKAVYPRVKAADPEAQVLVGGLLLDCDPVNPPETAPGSGVPKYCDPGKYLEGILVAGGGDYFDGVSFHAYDFFDVVSGYYANPNWHSGYGGSGLVPVLVPKTRYLKSVLAAYGYFDKYLLNTETSLLCGRVGNEPECNDGRHLVMKTNYVAMSYAAAAAEGLAGNIWFTLDNAWKRSALTETNGASTSAYIAYQFAATQLNGATFWGNVAEFPGVMGYKFRREGVEVWVVWSLDTISHLIELPEMPMQIYNVLGGQVNPSQTVQVEVSPLYIVLEP